jgi:hypothetical protein
MKLKNPEYDFLAEYDSKMLELYSNKRPSKKKNHKIEIS